MTRLARRVSHFGVRKESEEKDHANPSAGFTPRCWRASRRRGLQIFTDDIPRLPGVTAVLAYLVSTTERPYNYMYEPPAGTARENCEYRESPVWIKDARAMASPPAIHVEGFELWDAPSAVTDFTDQDAIRSRYYAEAAELAKYVTGANHAHIFDHQVRQREAGRPTLTFGRHGDGSRPGAAGRIHNDYTETSGQKRFEILPLEERVRARAQRFANRQHLAFHRRQSRRYAVGSVRCMLDLGKGSGRRRPPLPRLVRRALSRAGIAASSLGLLLRDGPQRGVSLQAIRLASERGRSLHAPFSLRSSRHPVGCAAQAEHRDPLPRDLQLTECPLVLAAKDARQ